MAATEAGADEGALTRRFKVDIPTSWKRLSSESSDLKRAAATLAAETAMNEVRFVDTTLRDGQQSLWAYGMRTGMILPVADRIDQAGFEAIELGGPVELPKCVRELREDPWERYSACRRENQKNPASGDSWQPERIRDLSSRRASALR